MTKQPKSSDSNFIVKDAKKYRIINIFLYIMTVLSVIGAFELNSFTRRKLGVLRHIVYLNGVWEKAVPISSIRNIAIILLIASIIYVFRMITKSDKANKIHNIIYLAVSVFTLSFIFTQSKETLRAYYMIGTLLLIGCIFQFINIMIYKSKNSKR